MSVEIALADFPLRTRDKLRYGDTDRQGHINNAVFSTLFETGRVELIYDPVQPLAEPGTAFVIARLEVDFRAELLWPGEVESGMRVASIGRSSVRLEQVIFQSGRCAANAVTVIVLVDEATRRSRPFSDAVRERLLALMPPKSG
ncbi:thioesterase [Bosea sp. WAO]|uniref:acyl-CoA thioesterase n=1 Tax=Bosea sp. WAO TaxID=406341 RepID=UPI0007484F96|nr:thioesterase family protein [Bosea sp. WAO]KUL96313.1 thioesterase [Bosea sp. WAO]